MTTLRRLAFPLRLVAARLGAGGERALLVAVGVVAGAAVLAAVLAGRLVMQDRALAESTAQLAPADRVVQVAWSGAVDSFAQHDRFVAPRIRSVTGQEPARAMLFREASVQGRLVNLRAADDLGRFVRITSGRLPRICVPQHCEVLRLEGRGPIPSTPALRLVEVGRASLRRDAPIGPFVLPTPPTEQVARAVRYHTPPPSPVVIANGVQGLSATRELQTFYRAYAWVVDVRGADVHPWSIGEFGRKVQRLSAQVESNAAGEFQVTAPTVQLAAATTASDAAARRLLLLGGEGACLLLAFTILAAGALRRDVSDARRRLIWFGARRWQVELHTLAESVALATVGTIVGWVAGGAIAAAVAGEAGSPARAVVQHGLLSGRGLLAALCLAATAGALLYVTVRSRPVQFGRLAFTPLDAAAIGAVAVVLTGWARGSVDAQALSEQRRHEHVPPARAGPDRLRRSGRRGAALGAGAARDRPARAARADRAAARSRLARAQPGARGDRLHVPRREPGACALRRLLPVDAAHGPARRGALRSAGVVPALGGLRPTRPGPARRAALALSDDSDAGAPVDGERPVRHDVHVPRPAVGLAGGNRRLAAGLRSASAPIARVVVDTGAAVGPAHDVTPAGTSVLAARLGDRRRHRGARDLPLAPRRLSSRRHRPHERHAHRHAARTDSLRQRDARTAAVRRVEQRPHHGERRHRHPAVGEGHPLVRAAPRRRTPRAARVHALDRDRRGRRCARPGSASS